MRLSLIILFMVLGSLVFSQTSPKFNFVVDNATTPFGINLPRGCIIYDLAADSLYILTAAAPSTATINTTSWSLLYPQADTDDHGALSGLTDDDHTQYALLDGRVGDTLNINTIQAIAPASEWQLKINGNLTIDNGGIALGTSENVIQGGTSGDDYFIDMSPRYSGTNKFRFIDHPLYLGLYPSSSIPSYLGFDIPGATWSYIFGYRIYTANITDDSTNVLLNVPVKAYDSVLVTMNDTVGKKLLTIPNVSIPNTYVAIGTGTGISGTDEVTFDGTYFKINDYLKVTHSDGGAYIYMGNQGDYIYHDGGAFNFIVSNKTLSFNGNAIYSEFNNLSLGTATYRWHSLYTKNITDDSTNVLLNVPVKAYDTVLVTQGDTVGKKLLVIPEVNWDTLANYQTKADTSTYDATRAWVTGRGYLTSALQWSDTTASAGVGLATYDDLRNIDVSPLVLSVHALSLDPASSATYYFGNQSVSPQTTPDVLRVYIPYSGTVKKISIWGRHWAVAGSSENISFYFVLNNTTSTLIATIGTTIREKHYYNTSLDIAVSAGDYFEIKMVCPVWATAPTGIRYGGNVFIEME